MAGAHSESRILASLRSQAESFLPRARAPFSRQPSAGVLLSTAGIMIPGVRVESASFSLTIPAALNAISTAMASGIRSYVAFVQVGPIPATTSALLEHHGLAVHPEPDVWLARTPLPDPALLLDPFEPVGEHERHPAERARIIAQRAYIPESGFPVGAILDTPSGSLPGVNVEHPDWTCILCAERNALGTAVTYDALPASVMGVSCPTDPGGSPCGACRQLIAELIPEATLWMDRGEDLPLALTPDHLLPLAFSGRTLGKQ